MAIEEEMGNRMKELGGKHNVIRETVFSVLYRDASLNTVQELLDESGLHIQASEDFTKSLLKREGGKHS